MSSSPGLSRPMQGGLTVAALVLLPLVAVAGSDGLRAGLDFTTGVLTLVSLTAAVAWGLLATDRIFLSTRQRLVGQGIHRAAAVTSLGFLLLHGTVKVSLGHVELIGALIPFGLGVSGTAGLIGFGSLAGLLMIVAAATGAMRSVFATPGKIAGRWRALHALAYPAWCSALLHGLYAGRQAATWVVVMYSLCLLAVAAALCLRLLPAPTKRLITDLVTTLISPDGPPQDSDPVKRNSPLPGAEHLPPQPGEGRRRQGLPPEAPGWGDEREVRGTPVRPRTLAAPSPPLYEAPQYGATPDETPLYEAPPRSSERLGPGLDATTAAGATTGPGPGPGISAAYRAVSRPPEPPQERAADGLWPAPSPAPPAQALRPPYGPDPSYDPEHAYARTQESTAYSTPSPAETAYAYVPPSPAETAYVPPSPAETAYATPLYTETAYAYPDATSTGYVPPADPSGYDGSGARGIADTEQLPGLYPPPAGEPWHAPAGDRP
ncbi:hypothetical protein ABZS61_02275 [Streptomyces sp. NPDC005566]|uniref:hypothetical protein n=1 Tax=Streptomyces sp. NPDC005566 TaxID=3156886 RepID=UPI0033BEE41B